MLQYYFSDYVYFQCSIKTQSVALNGWITRQACSLITRKITCRPHAPWFTEEIHEAKLKVCERKWVTTKLEIHRQNEESYNYHQLLKKAKCDYHKSELANCISHELFTKINSLCKPKSPKILPADSLDVPLVERFSDFFADKIKFITDTLKATPKTELSHEINEIITC